MSKTKLEFYKGKGSGEIEEDPDNYEAHFPNLEVMERAKNLPTYSGRTEGGRLGSGDADGGNSS
tara:strand:- start:1165 stop:1356 length:192 start_codon:yes stop_codon:yes gene_type:complete